MSDSRRIKRTQSMMTVNANKKAPPDTTTTAPKDYNDNDNTATFTDQDTKSKRQRFRQMFRTFRRDKHSVPVSPCDSSDNAADTAIPVLTLNTTSPASITPIPPLPNSARGAETFSDEKIDAPSGSFTSRHRHRHMQSLQPQNSTSINITAMGTSHRRQSSLSRTPNPATSESSNDTSGSERSSTSGLESPMCSPRPTQPSTTGTTSFYVHHARRPSPGNGEDISWELTPPPPPQQQQQQQPSSSLSSQQVSGGTQKRRGFLRRGITTLTFGKSAAKREKLVLVRVRFDKSVQDSNRRTPHEFNFIVDASVSTGNDVLNTIIAAKDLPKDTHYALFRASSRTPIDLRAPFSSCVLSLRPTYINEDASKNCLPDSIELILRAERNRSSSAVSEDSVSQQLTFGGLIVNGVANNPPGGTSSNHFSMSASGGGGGGGGGSPSPYHYYQPPPKIQLSGQEEGGEGVGLGAGEGAQAAIPLSSLMQSQVGQGLIFGAKGRRGGGGGGVGVGVGVGGTVGGNNPGGILLSDKYRRVQAARSDIRLAMLCSTCTLAVYEHIYRVPCELPVERALPELTWCNKVFEKSSILMPSHNKRSNSANNTVSLFPQSSGGGGVSADFDEWGLDEEAIEPLRPNDYVLIPPRNTGIRALEMPIPAYISRFTGSARRGGRPVAIWLQGMEHPVAASAEWMRATSAKYGVDIVAAEYRGVGVRERYCVWSDIKGSFLLDDLAAVVRHVVSLWGSPYVICGEKIGALLALNFALSLASTQLSSSDGDNDDDGAGKRELEKCKELLVGVSADDIPLTDDLLECAKKTGKNLSCPVACSYAEGTQQKDKSDFASYFPNFNLFDSDAWSYAMDTAFPAASPMGSECPTLATPATPPPLTGSKKSEKRGPSDIVVLREWLRRRGYDQWQACVLESEGIRSIEKAARVHALEDEAKCSMKMMMPWSDVKKTFSCYAKVVPRNKRNKRVAIKKKPQGWAVMASPNSSASKKSPLLPLL